MGKVPKKTQQVCITNLYDFFPPNSMHLCIVFLRREKALEGKSRNSHSVHCPYFTDDKQEFWWCYISDRKNHALVTPPTFVTNLVEREEVELKFTAPPKPGENYGKSILLRYFHN